MAKEEVVKKTKMDAKNLAIVFGPNLMRKRLLTLDDLLNDTARANTLIEQMIKHFDRIFELHEEIKLPSYNEGEVPELAASAEVASEVKRRSLSRAIKFNSKSKAYGKFHATLRLGVIKMAETRLKEHQQAETVDDYIKSTQASPDNIDIDTIQGFIMSNMRVRSASKGQKTIQRQHSKVWEDFFQVPEPEGEREEDQRIFTIKRDYSDKIIMEIQ
jgi:hypothetical protein